MGSIAKIFKDKLIANYLSKFTRDDIPDFDKKWQIICRWRKSCLQGDLNQTKETEIQGAFMMQIFDQILGYSSVTSTDTDYYHQKQEFNSALDASEADGGLGFFSAVHKVRDVRAVVELKDATTSLDKKQNRSSHLTPVEQAFFYANKNGSKCGWVIVSNFIETRLYKSNSMLEYEVFDIRNMDSEAEFLRFYFFLCKDHLINQTGKSKIDDLYQENEEMGIAISNDFYKTYKRIRNNLYVSLKDHNPDKDELLLFTKSQKIMDRFIFICFCEDCGLLPPKIFQRLIDSSQNSFSFSPTKLWDELRGLFRAIDIGSPPMQINRYNGGLFKADPELDGLVIMDDVLIAFSELATYDFGSDLNVNILGQIFEQSISDVEQIKREIAGEDTASDSKGKQKDDGIFYTPYYVTRYIVEQTVGAYLNEKKEALKRTIFAQGPFKAEVYKASTKRKVTIELRSWVEIPDLTPDMTEAEELQRDAVILLHNAYWTAYEDILRDVKICDPACGSGAFLNQCFDFLHEEMNFVLDMKHQFDADKASYSLFDIDKQILQNNLFGVDINPESVEITKLSLWLKTAKQNQTLASLDDNIKCGNSIIDDATVTETVVFNWQEQFQEIFANGGFDVIVGNPPYGAKLSDSEKAYVFEKYASTQGGVDTYKTFFELGFSLLKENGYLGYITPNTFLMQDMCSILRTLIMENYTFCNLVELYNVFPNAVVEPVITVFKKHKATGSEQIDVILVPRKTKLSSTFVNEGQLKHVPISQISKEDGYIFRYKGTDGGAQLIKKLYFNAATIGDHFRTTTGIELYGIGKGTPPQTAKTLEEKPFTCFTKEDDTCIPLIRGTDIFRFATKWHGEYVKYGEWLRVPKTRELFEREKLFIRRTGDYPLACYDNQNYIPERASHALYKWDDSCTIDIKYILGLLNSKLMRWVFRYNNAQLVGKPLAQVNAKYIERLPLKHSCEAVLVGIVDDLITLYGEKIDGVDHFLHFLQATYSFEKPTEKLKEFYLLSFGEFVDELKKKKVALSAKEKMELLSVYDEQKKYLNSIVDKIGKAEQSLDQTVYEIYSLTHEEIEIIEN